MSPRQLIRLSESRRSDDYDDQKSPSQIQNAETLAENHQEFLTYLLSQVREILGEANWNDPVAVNLVDMLKWRDAFPAVCLSTDEIGDCVYSRAEPVGGVYRVTKCDPYDKATMPSVGIIRAKSSSVDCEVQYRGPLTGIYSGLDREKPLFVAADGGLTQDRPDPTGTDPVWIQHMGAPLGDSEFVIAPSYFLSKLKP